MEKRDLINKIYQEYNLELLRNDQIRQISRKVQDGTATYTEAYELAEQTGKMIGDIVYDNLEEVWETMSFEDATELIPRSLKANHDYVAAATEKIEETINENAKVGLKPLKPDFDDKKAREIASDVANGISKEKFSTDCETFSRRTVDKSAQINAAAKERAGLTVKVTRKYDDVGLSNGRTCTWCLTRECEDMPYSEAYALGAFERHDGCGCLIEYTNARGETTWQDAKGGWHEVQNSNAINSRKRVGLDDTFLLQTGGREIGGHYYPYSPEDDKNDKAAAKRYEEITRNNADIKRISQNTGFGIKEIEQIKSHIFFDKHVLYDGYERLAPDYNMAVAWNRLIQGDFLDRDITLLNHELLEEKIEKEYNISLGEAHARATEVYDWWGQLMKETEGIGEPSDLL